MSCATGHCWDMALRSGYDRVVKIFAQYCRSGEAYDMDGLIRTHAFQDDAFQQVVEWKDDSVSEVHEMSFGVSIQSGNAPPGILRNPPALQFCTALNGMQ